MYVSQQHPLQMIVAVTSSASSSEEFHGLEFSFRRSSLENSQRLQKLLPPVITTYFSSTEYRGCIAALTKGNRLVNLNRPVQASLSTPSLSYLDNIQAASD